MMKRNILAVVIPALLAAGAANAAEIYNKDGNKLDLYGKVDARHSFSDNNKQDGDKSYVRFGFKGETQITDQLTVTASGNTTFKQTTLKTQALKTATQPVWALLV